MSSGHVPSHTELLRLVTTSAGNSLALYLERKPSWKGELPLPSPDCISLSYFDSLKAELETGIWIIMAYGGGTLRRKGVRGGGSSEKGRSKDVVPTGAWPQPGPPGALGTNCTTESAPL